MEGNVVENVLTGGAGSDDGKLIPTILEPADGGFSSALKKNQTKGFERQQTKPKNIKNNKISSEKMAQTMAKRDTIQELINKNEESVVKTRKYQDIELEINDKKLKQMQTA